MSFGARLIFFIGVALDSSPPFLLGALRFTAAGILLLAVCYFRGEQVFRKKLIICSAISGIVLLFVDMAVATGTVTGIVAGSVVITVRSTVNTSLSATKNVTIDSASALIANYPWSNYTIGRKSKYHSRESRQDTKQR